jgi:hypothetical protein
MTREQVDPLVQVLRDSYPPEDGDPGRPDDDRPEPECSEPSTNGHAPVAVAEQQGVDVADTEEMVNDPTVTLAEFIKTRRDNDAEALVTCDQGTALPAGGLGVYVGKASGGKTTQIVDLALHASAGLDYLGLHFPRPLRILFVENEGPREAFREKLETRLAHWSHKEEDGRLKGEPIRIWDDPARWGLVRVSDDEQRAQLQQVVKAHSIDLVISDSLTRFGMRGNGTPEETRDFMLLLSECGLGRTLAFLLLHHTRTRTEAGEDELEMASGAWAPHADAILMLKKLDGNRARLSYPKLRWARGTRPACILAFDPETEAFSLVKEEDDATERVGPDTYEQRILDYLAEHPWATTEDVDHEPEGREQQLREARKRLKEAGRVYSTPSAEVGRPGKGLRWNLSNDAAPNPVPLPGTGQDENDSDPLQDGQPRPPVRPVRRDGDGRTGLHDPADEVLA